MITYRELNKFADFRVRTDKYREKDLSKRQLVIENFLTKRGKIKILNDIKLIKFMKISK